MDLFRSLLKDDQHGQEYPVNDIKHELYGKNLACWCTLNELYHADILLEIADN